jgi:hypothetical protein
MDKLLEWGHEKWLKAKLGSPLWLQRTLIHTLYEAKEVARLLGSPYLTVHQWQGQGQGGPLVVNYAGLGDAKPFLKSKLFIERPAEREVGSVPAWRISELTNLSPGDIAIVEADRRLIRQLPDRCAFVLPVFVEMVVDVQGDWEDLESRFRKSIRSERRLQRKYGYRYEASNSDQDFETFYRDMYLPTMKVRHGDLAVPMPHNEAYQYFRHGLLFWVLRDGQRVCGSVCYLERDIAHFILVGVFKGDQQLMKEGAIGALNYLRIQWANQNGHRAVDLGYCRPFMTSLFHYKRKWGTTVKAPSDLRPQFWIKLQRNTPAVYQFMKDNPCIVVNEKHQLYWLVMTDHPETARIEHETEWRKELETPGLQGLLIRSMADFFDGPTASVFDVDPATSIIF